MQAILNRQRNSSRSFVLKAWIAMLSVLTLCLGATVARATGPTVPPVVVSQLTWLNTLGGGAISSGDPAGTSFAVNQNGDVILANTSSILLFNGQTGAVTTLGTWSNAQAVAVDSQNNLYVANLYGDTIVKVPFVNGAYAAFSSSPAGACTGSDTVACSLPNLTVASNGYYFQVNSIAVDSNGDFFWAVNNSGTGANGIFECSAACLYGSGASVQMIYKEPTTTPTPTATSGTGQLILGGIAIDPWGNVFFTDSSVYITSSYGIVSYYSDVNELPTSTGAGYGSVTTGYAAVPTVLMTESEGATPSAYDDELDGVAVDSTGTVYVADQYNGIFGIPNSGGTIPLTSGQPTYLYGISSQGGKTMALDGKGNIYVTANNNAINSATYTDTLGRISLNNLAISPSPVGTPASATNVTVIDNAGGCTTPPVITFSAAENSLTSSEFSGVTTGACSSQSYGVGSMFAATVTYTPTAVGERTAVLTASDATNSVTGMATASGVGDGSMLTFDPGSLTSYTTGFTAPISITSQAGNIFVADESAGAVYEIASGTTTPVSIGSGFVAPSAVAQDAAGNLYIADATLSEIFEIANTSTTGSFTAGTQTTVVSSSDLFNGTALHGPLGLAVGPSGVLYVADFINNRVVTYNPSNGDTGVFATGAHGPQAVAVDASGNVYTAIPDAGNVVELSGGGVVTTLTVPGVSSPSAVAVDASGSLYVGGSGSGAIVRVPNESGVLTTADAITIESNPDGVNGLALDGSGNLYAADNSAKAVYAYQRTMPTVDFGTVNNPAVGTATVYAEVSGNMPVTLGTPFIGTPSNADFSVTSTTGSNKCQDGGVGPVGQWCAMTATFTPTVSDNGTISGTSTLTTTTPAGSFTLSMTATSAGTVPPTPQIISGFPATGTGVVGQQMMLTASGGGSGKPVVFTIDGTSTGTGSISGNMLTITGAGTIVVDANQAGGTNSSIVYTAAPQAQETITVTALSTPGGASAGILTSQLTWLGAYPAGGDLAGGVAAGDSFGINSHGDILASTTYGGTVIEVNGQTGAVTTLGSYGEYGNTGGVAVDNNDNLYVGGLYGGSNIVAKVPYVSGAYAPLTDATSGTAPGNCTGTDTTECVVGPLKNISGGFGVAAMKFDAAGDLFMATSDQGNPHSIWECTAACLATGTPAPVELFQEPTGSAPVTTGQLYIGGIAVDASGNLFFTDSNIINPSNNQDESSYSDLYELPTSTGTGFGGATTGYAATPTLLQTFTVAAPTTYDDALDGVAVDASGNVYYITQSEGIFAFPNVSGSIDTSAGYAVSSQGGKGLSSDASGNLYVTGYSTAVNASGAETVGRITLNSVIAPPATVDGAATMASATVVDNYSGCSDSPVLSITSSQADFSATAGTTCSTVSGTTSGNSFASAVSGSSFPATVNFAPTASAGGTETTTLTISDTTNGGQGTATASGVGELTGQTISFPALSTPVTFATGMTVSLSATGGVSGSPIVFTVDGTSTGAGTIGSVSTTGATTTATLTVTMAGSITIDANQAGGGGYGSATQQQQTVVVSQAAQAITITSPTASQQLTMSGASLAVPLVATGGLSGNAVTYTIDGSSTGTGTISGSTLTVTGAGNFTIDANQASNSNYLAAPQVSVSFTVIAGAPQTISFTQPASPVTYAYGMAIPLVATGGGSGNPVVFSVDASSTGSGIITGNSLSVTGVGTIVIDANQAASPGYTAATQVQASVVVDPAAQVIAFAQPNSPVTYVSGSSSLTIPLSATGGSSGNAVTFTVDPSSTASGTISGDTLTVTAAGTCGTSNPGCAGNIVIDANQAGTANYTPAAQTQMTVVVYGTASTFTFTAPPSTLTVVTGSSASTTIAISPEYGFSGTITFACSNLPVGDSCTFTPPSLTFTSASNASQSTTLTIASSTPLAANQPGSLPMIPAATMAAALCFLGFRKRNRLQLLVLLAVSLVGLGVMSGCGGKYKSSTTTVTHATVTITATSGATQQTTTLTLWQQ